MLAGIIAAQILRNPYLEGGAALVVTGGLVSGTAKGGAGMFVASAGVVWMGGKTGLMGAFPAGVVAGAVGGKNGEAAGGFARRFRMLLLPL